MKKTNESPNFSPAFLAIIDTLIQRYEKAGSAMLKVPRLELSSLVDVQLDDVGALKLYAVCANIRRAMRERGYKIQIGNVVYISRLPVTHVDPEQWPALIENIGTRLQNLYTETNAPFLRLSPAKFRNIATIWPSDNQTFNDQCVEAMRKRGYALTFRVQYIDLRPLEMVEPKRRKPEPAGAPEVPRVHVLNARAMLPMLLQPRRTGWKRGYTHAIIVNALTRYNQPVALTHVIVHFHDMVTDETGVESTHLAITNGDVVLTNNAGYLKFKEATDLMCIQSGHTYRIALGVTHL